MAKNLKKVQKISLTKFWLLIKSKFNLKRNKFLPLKVSLISLAGILILFFLFFGVYSVIYAKHIYAHQFIGKTDLGGKTKDEAKNILTEVAKLFLEKEIILNYEPKEGQNGKEYKFKPEELGLQYDVEKTASGVWDWGRKEKAGRSFLEQLQSIFSKKNHNFSYTINNEALDKKISDIALEQDQPEKDFAIKYENGKFVLSTERAEGWRISQLALKDKIGTKIAKAEVENINFGTETFKPQILQENAEKRLVEANAIISDGDLLLSFETQEFTADTDTIGSLIKYESAGDDLKLVFDKEREKLFIQNIAGSIDVEAKDAKLGISDGKVTIIEVATLGKTLDQTQTAVDIENALSSRIEGQTSKTDSKKINLKVEVRKPAVTNDSIGNLGINELIGTGTTNFVKSPTNRIFNINVGAKAINGSLVAPGETFSTIGKLGKIDANSGYLPELVIKNNTTVPDYGGGLCQVSTTLFRAALNAGLKITERQNHSYRVSYYEPPIGMDATIYDPSPDFKFVNNYSTHILIQSKIVGTKITFEIYGTKDGRVATTSTPTGYNYVEPPPRQDTETDTLPAGESKQIQKPHQGASASFNYHVERNGEVLQDKTFVSVYVALPEKWLIGKAPAPVPAEPAPAPAPVPDPAPVPTP
jgi:vancomycin resistance protein YoaR